MAVTRAAATRAATRVAEATEAPGRCVEARCPSRRSFARSVAASILTASLVVLCLSGARAARADEGSAARLYVLGEGERVNPAFAPSRMGAREASLSAFAGETVAFQVVIDGGDDPVSDVTVDLAPLEAHGGSVVHPELYVEHFVPITKRSRNERERGASLGWTSAARPDDEGMLGALPDALVPLSLARCDGTQGRTFCPYPLQIAGGSVGAILVDLRVPEDLPAGRYTSRVIVESAGRPLGSIPVTLETSAVRLPYRAASVFAFYSFDTLAARFDDPRRVERQLWQWLHASGVDPMPSITSQADLDRTEEGYEGRWFRPEAGYAGPGDEQRPEVAAVGAYGSLGEPTREKVDLALSLGNRLADAMVKDRFVYTVDEDCKSPLGQRWQSALRGRDPLLAGRTCDDDPRTQQADLVLMPAQAFRPEAAREARRSGKKVFVYNGQLPFTGTLLLDAPLTSLTVNGWIAASYDVGRWFLWETIFWNDDNRGGAGARDPFADPETFHNADGDACLADGLLLYPGRQPRFPAHSLGVDAVLPSMRLFALRRGIEDAGLIALAASVDPDATLRVVREAVPRAFDEVRADEPTPFELDPKTLARLRAELRALATGARPSAARAILEGAVPAADAEARAELVKLRARPRAKHTRLVPARLDGVALPTLALLLFALGLVSVRVLDGARRRP